MADDHSAMAPPRGGGEASLKVEKEAGLEQGDCSGHEFALMRLLTPGGGDCEKMGLGPPLLLLSLISPMAGVEAVTMEPATIGRRVGQFRNRDVRREGGTAVPPGPPRNM